METAGLLSGKHFNDNAFGSSLAVSYICYFFKRSFSIFIDLWLVYDS